MDRLCDEILQLILFRLNDPTSFTLASKRFRQVSQDPYVRAQYFLTRHGRIQAMYMALGRGKIVTEQVLDILLASGACLSRYLIQVAIHHYFRTTSHFIKTNWVRSVPLPVFSYFLKLASQLYGEIPMGKGEDDGAIFNGFLKESRFPLTMKSIQWEEVRDILDKYKFIPFSNRDPIMATFPLALAVEPRLLPYAVKNGFKMDTKYRDFVFRKMFEKPSVPNEGRADEIVHNVRELCRLDATMFLSRTVAAEVCMEAKTNEHGYSALKRLDKSGQLLFDLSPLVEELIKTFIKTRSISNHYTIQCLRQLYTDFPSPDPIVRTVMLLTVFLSENCSAHTTPSLASKLESLGLAPLTQKDVYNIMINPFVEKYTPILEYARSEVGLAGKEMKELLEGVTFKCLEIGCKGKTLKRLLESFPPLRESVTLQVLQQYQINLDDLPPAEDRSACWRYMASLCRYFVPYKPPEDIIVEFDRPVGVVNDGGLDDEEEASARHELVEESRRTAEFGNFDLGRVGQDTLTNMIRQDELAPARARRRSYIGYTTCDTNGKLHYPNDPLHVGQCIKEQYGIRSRVTAVFMTHAIINGDATVLHNFLQHTEDSRRTVSNHVPITLKHFKLLARLGREPSCYLYREIEFGAEFYFTEEDYLALNEALDAKKKGKVKVEATVNSIPSVSSSPPCANPRGRKRPRRAAALARSYLVPDSDDDDIVDEDADPVEMLGNQAKKKRKRAETNLQRWLKHLAILFKEEQKKYNEEKRRVERSGEKKRVTKNNFLKSLSTNLRNLRKIEHEERLLLYGPEVPDEGFTDNDDDDDEYHCKTARPRPRKFNNAPSHACL